MPAETLPGSALSSICFMDLKEVHFFGLRLWFWEQGVPRMSSQLLPRGGNREALFVLRLLRPPGGPKYQLKEDRVSTLVLDRATLIFFHSLLTLWHDTSPTGDQMPLSFCSAREEEMWEEKGAALGTVQTLEERDGKWARTKDLCRPGESMFAF